MSPLLKGLIIGFSIAAPVGPIGLLCIRRSLADGRLAGFISGLGAATADAIYGVVAALGLTAITSALVAQRAWLQFGGGVFLIYLGIATLRERPGGAGRTGPPPPGAKTENLPAAYVSTLALTLTNPMTILSFLAIFAGLGPGAGAAGALAAGGFDGLTAGWLVLGVFLGSAAWWLLLCSAAGWLGQRLEYGGLRVVNIASGLVIAGFGAWQLALLR